MADIRFVTARQLVWDKEAWRRPAFVGLVIRLLQEVLDGEDEDTATLAEATRLIKNLRQTAKPPPLI